MKARSKEIFYNVCLLILKAKLKQYFCFFVEADFK
jgi:hypothetical protein